jgi:uncharacterized protein with von Willebrand factor type A (vWA) domain
MAPEATAGALAARIDALAAALRLAGIAPTRSAQLLASASEAAMHAVTLDAMRAPLATAVANPPADAEPLPLAA